MAHIHLLLGPVGAGKSTYARQLSAQQRAIRLILDDWMARLYGADERPTSGRVAWYLERRDRCLAQIWEYQPGAYATLGPTPEEHAVRQDDGGLAGALQAFEDVK